MRKLQGRTSAEMHFFVQGNNGINFFFKKSVGRGHGDGGLGLGPGEYVRT